MTKKYRILRVSGLILFSSLGAYLIGTCVFPVDKSKYILPEDKLLTVAGAFTAGERKDVSAGRGTSRVFEVNLTTYPGVKFINSGIFLRATDWKAIQSTIKYPDTVELKVLRSDFEKYLNRESLTIFQKIAAYPNNKFKFYSFRFKNKEYVSDLYEAAKDHQSDNMVPNFIAGLVSLLIGLYSYFSKK